MTRHPTDTTSANSASPLFATTRWSVVANAQSHGDERLRRAALSTLCESYWYPVYAFARRKGRSPEDSADLVQAFFTRFLERDDLALADAERGRFRSFLLGCFVHFASNEQERARTLKRGGGWVGFSLDEAFAEDRFLLEPSDEEDPERAFVRSWARTLLEGVALELRGEYEASGKRELYQSLEHLLQGEPSEESYLEIGERLGTTEGAVKVAAHRLRKRFGELLRRTIADTVEDPALVDDELRGLFEALG